MAREYRLLLSWDRAAPKGQEATSTEEPMFLRLRREINRVVHSSMTTPDIEAETVKRTLNTCGTIPQRKARTLRLPAEILALVEQKQRLLQRWRGACRLFEKEQLSRQYKSQTAAAKRAVNEYKRRKLEDLAGELEQAISCNQVNSTYAMVKRLAPVQAPQRVTVRQKERSPTWGHDGEISARRDALVTIFGAEPLSLEGEPQLHHAKKWIPPETPVTYKAGDAQWAIAQLSKWRGWSVHSERRSCRSKQFWRSGCRAAGSGGGKACAGSTIGMCASHFCSMDRDCNHRPCSARRQRRGDCFLTQTRKRHWRCEKLENYHVAQPHWQGMGKRISSSTCANSCKSCRPMPVCLTLQKEHARCSSYPGKRVRKIHQLESPSKSPQLSFRRFLV